MKFIISCLNNSFLNVKFFLGWNMLIIFIKEKINCKINQFKALVI